MKVQFLMIFEVDNCRDVGHAEEFLDAYRAAASEHADGFDERCSLHRATDEHLTQFDIWEGDGDRCFCPPNIDGQSPGEREETEGSDGS